MLCFVGVSSDSQAEIIPIEEAPIEISDIDVQEQITMLVNQIHAENRGLLIGVEQVMISSEDLRFYSHHDKESCANGGHAHILGAYSGDKIIIKDSGPELNKHTLYHEIGHNVWGRISTERKNQWIRLFSDTTEFLNAYAATNPNENFAENLACFFSNMHNCKERMTKDKVAFIEAILDEV